MAIVKPGWAWPRRSDDLDGCAGGDEQAGVGVAQVVEADAWYVGAGQVPVEELADRFGVDRVAGGVGEDRIIKLDWVAVASLHPTPATENRLGGWIEVDAAVGCGDTNSCRPPTAGVSSRVLSRGSRSSRWPCG